jgi:hypothetical protein
MQKQDLTNQRFGQITALHPHHKETTKHTYWWCRCDCGHEWAVNLANLKNQRSCRTCYTKRRTANYDTQTPEYRTWRSIKNRCLNARNPRYADYGGRGITVCKRWRESYPNFLADMGPRPSPEHSIDRIDNDGPYSPDNCRWATRAEQLSNRRDNMWVTHNGQTLTLQQWATHFGIPRNTLHYRYHQGDRGDRLFRKPKPKRLMLMHNGQTQPLKNWARELGINHNTLLARYQAGDRGDRLFRPVS